MPDLKTFFSVTNEALDRLTPEGAVEVFAALLRAEAFSSGIEIALVNVPSAITVPDGGIDAEVADARSGGTLGIINQGLTRYQIKTGRIYPNRPSAIKDILLTEKRDAIKPKVKSCLDNGGKLVIVLFGDDNPDPNEDLVSSFQDELAKNDGKCADARIKVWQQNQLLGYFEKFPSLALRVMGVSSLGFYTHEMWAGFQEMRRPLQLGEPQERFRDDEIRITLRSASTATLLHVYGEPGIGKTRLVLEALGAEDLAQGAAA